MKEGWKYKRLEEICSKGSSNISLNKIEANDGEYNLYGASGLVKGIDFYHQSQQYIGIVKDGSGVGRVNIYPPKSSLVGTMQYIFPNEDCEIGYLKYLLQGLHLEQFKTGAAIPHIYFKDYGKSIVPIPPLSEQQHIVEELDLLSSIIEKKKAQLNELDNLAQSLFYEMFGDPITNEKGWEVKTMNEVCNEIGDGLHGTPQYDPNGSIAFINGNNLIDGKITITDRTQYVNETEAKKIFIKMDSNTVLLSINGTLGKTAIYNNENVVLGKSACYLRLSNQLTAFYVMALMNTHTFKDFLESNSSKSTIKNVGLKAIRNYKVILPSLALQQQFASKIEAIEHQKELIKQSIKEVEMLLNSRMDYYFN